MQNNLFTKKLFPISILVLLQLLTVSCGDNKPTAPTETKPSSAVTEAETAEDKVRTEKSGVPAGTDFGGESVNIWYTTFGTQYTDLVGEQSGDVLDDAIYTQNLGVEETLNCKLNYQNSGVDQRNVNDAISKLLLADVTDYDLYHATQWSGGKLVVQGLYMNVADSPYISFDKPWWDLNYMKEMSIGNDKIFTLVGDYAIDRTRYLTCCYYNKRMYADYYGDADGLYQVVLDGKWTYDKLAEVSQEVFIDLDGNGKTDREDQIGTTLCWNDDIMSLMYCTGMRITRRDNDDLPYLVMNEERNFEVITKLYELARKTTGIFYGNEIEVTEAELNSAKFSEGTSLLMFGQFTAAEWLREMKDDYGIVPIPKFNEAQDHYYSSMYEVMRFMSVPYNCQKVDMACAAMEELSYNGYYDVLPVYYNLVLKNKYARDSASGEMIDLIRDNLTADIAVIYGSGFSNLCYEPRELIRSNKSDFASVYAKKEKWALKESTKLIEAFLSIEY